VAGTVRSVHWAGGASLAETFESTGRTLFLFHTREESDRFAVEMLPAAETRIVAPGTRFEEATSRRGVLRLPVTGGPGELYVEGEAASATFVGAGGAVQRGRSFAVGTNGGTLFVPHEAGFVTAWMTSAGDSGETEQAPPAAFVSTPARLQLAGRAQAFQLHPREPVLLHASTDAGASIRLHRGSERQTWIRPLGGTLHAYLPAGPATLTLRALAGAALAGSLELTTSPIVPVGEGLGPEALLPPGGSRAYRFAISQTGPVGVGVRADADVVGCDLVDAAGRLLGRGVVQMHDLDPGDYVMVLRAPTDAAPVRIQPAVVGLERPSTGPPEDVIRRYLGEGAK
jgi:hypothetical protein